LVHFILKDFADVEVPDFYGAVRSDEYVGRLEIAVDNIKLVERTEAVHHLNEDSPDLLFTKVSAILRHR
jgi:hypothetical protein